MAEDKSSKLRPVSKEEPAASWLGASDYLDKVRPYLPSQFRHVSLRELAVMCGLGLMLALAVGPNLLRITSWPVLFGLTIVGAVFVGLANHVWLRHLLGPELGRATKNLVFVSAILVIMVFLAKGYFLFCSALLEDVEKVTPQALAFGTPLAAGPLVVSLFLGPQAGMLMALATGFMSGLIWPDSGGLFVYFLLTGMAAAHLVRGGRTRGSFIQAGAESSLIGVVILLGLALLRGWVITWDFPLALATAALSGLFSGVLAAGMAPVAEMVFGYTTDSRLMEQSSLDHPMLQELMLKAPGTYHHSLIVSSLVEAAAKEIGANHMLARAAALYHDIGKVKKALYFVENQMSCANRHEKLAPSMSALILISHVKEGVELAKQYRLSQPIIDIMGQHHGTRLIHYFYNKAVEKRLKSGESEPDPEAYRYPGPRPQTREAALVMLADSVEAASRALENPTPARIRGLVQTNINKIFAEGQLDECELTLKDLHNIARIFNTILTGIFHQRVEYPSSGEEKGKKRNGDSDKQPAKSQGSQSGGTGDSAGAGLKRLGMR